MSGLVSGLVWELPISQEFSREKKYILLAYADHADQNGRNIYPSVDLIASKTGYSERAVQYITNDLTEIGMLIEDGMGPKGTNKFRIPLARVDGFAKIEPCPAAKELAKEPEKQEKPAAKKPTGGGAKIAPLAPERIAPEGFAPEPSVVVKSYEDEEEKVFQDFGFSADLGQLLLDAGIFMPIWKLVDARLIEGWSETDVCAVMSWMRSTRTDATKIASGFCTRIREKTKAPSKYYPLPPRESSPADDEWEEPEVAQVDNPALDIVPDGSSMTIRQAWDAMLMQLVQQMPRARYEEYVASAVVVDFAGDKLVVQAENTTTSDWLDGHLRSTVRRSLAGMLSREVDVEFVAAEGER